MTGAELASWVEGRTKAAVLDFVRSTMSPGPDFAPVAERIATSTTTARCGSSSRFRLSSTSCSPMLELFDLLRAHDFRIFVCSGGGRDFMRVFAGGNADVDVDVLSGAAFSLLVGHDDDEREFAYTTSSEASVARAADLGWTVVSMKDDWTTVF